MLKGMLLQPGGSPVGKLGTVFTFCVDAFGFARDAGLLREADSFSHDINLVANVPLSAHWETIEKCRCARFQRATAIYVLYVCTCIKPS